MKDSFSDLLVILVLLVTLIGGGGVLVKKLANKVELCEPFDLIYFDDYLPQDFILASDGEVMEEFPCYRIDLK